MSKVKPGEDYRGQTDKTSFKQTDQPWKKPVEKEQGPKGAPDVDLETWQESNTH